MATEANAKNNRGWWWLVAQTMLLLSVFAAGLYFPGRPWHSWIPTVGMGLTVISALIGIAGCRALGRNLSALPQPASGGKLVTTGLYRWVRHPMYIGLLMLAVGWAIWCFSLVALLIALIFGVFLRSKATAEDRWLTRFYPEHRDYAARTWCFFLGRNKCI